MLIMGKESGIYIITNIVNSKFYIGSAVNFYNRKQAHFSTLRKNRHGNIKLQRSFNKHGEYDFTFEVLEYVELKENLIEREQYYIDTLNPQYNICKFAGSTLGMIHTQEARDKIGEASKLRLISKESTNRQVESRRINGNYIISKETREKMSIVKLGKKASIETRLKMCMSQKNRENHPSCSEETKNKISKKVIIRYKYRLEIECPYCKHTSKNYANMYKIHFNRCKMNPDQTNIYKVSYETKKKTSESCKGRSHSDETKEKIKQSWVIRKQKNDHSNNN